MGTFIVVLIFLIVICFTGQYFLPLLIPLFLIGLVCIFVYSCATDNHTNINQYEDEYSEQENEESYENYYEEEYSEEGEKL